MKVDNKHKPVLRLETNCLYPCLSDASRAMGRYPGYVSEHRKLGIPCVDTEGNVWTFQNVDADLVPLHRKTRDCYIEEFPGKVFDSVVAASRAIGRSDGYINDALHANKEITNKAGQVMHFHFVAEKESI